MNKLLDEELIAQAMREAARIATEGTRFEKAGRFNTAPASYEVPAKEQPAPKKRRRAAA